MGRLSEWLERHNAVDWAKFFCYSGVLLYLFVEYVL